MGSHLIEFLVIGDLVQVLDQPLQKIKIRGGELPEETPDVGQTRFQALNF